MTEGNKRESPQHLQHKGLVREDFIIIVQKRSNVEKS